jgi:hypothetical protein
MARPREHATATVGRWRYRRRGVWFSACCLRRRRKAWPVAAFHAGALSGRPLGGARHSASVGGGQGRKSGGDAHLCWGGGTAAVGAGASRRHRRCSRLRLGFKSGATGPAGGEAERREKRGGRCEDAWSLTRRKPASGTGAARQLLVLRSGLAPRKSEDKAASDRRWRLRTIVVGGRLLHTANRQCDGNCPAQPIGRRRRLTLSQAGGPHSAAI